MSGPADFLTLRVTGPGWLAPEVAPSHYDDDKGRLEAIFAYYANVVCFRIMFQSLGVRHVYGVSIRLPSPSVST